MIVLKTNKENQQHIFRRRITESTSIESPVQEASLLLWVYRCKISCGMEIFRITSCLSRFPKPIIHVFHTGQGNCEEPNAGDWLLVV